MATPLSRTEPQAEGQARHRTLRRLPARLRASLTNVGPGIVAGASDNDPTTVASLAVIGSTTVYGLAWLVVLVIPMLAVVQMVSAAVGTVARAGLEDAICKAYGRAWGIVALVVVLAVNLLTLGADMKAAGASLALLFGAPDHWFILPFGLVVVALLVFGAYQTVEHVLRYVTLVFLAYVVSAFLARPNWSAVLHHIVVPTFRWDTDFVQGALALLGTTLTAYAYVWESIEIKSRRPPLRRLGLVQVDAALGTVAAGATFLFIVIATGTTLGVHHKTVQTAQDAAVALAPLAGRYASLIFGVGLLGSALIAVPVLAGTCAYVLAETFGWRGDLDASFARAPRFYWALIISLVIGVAIAYLPVAPIKLLFWSSIAGGLGTPITLALMMLVARSRTVMDQHRIGTRLALAGWAVTGIVATACVIFLYQTFTGQGGGS